MAINLTKNYRLDVIKMHQAEVGGRLFSAKINEVLPNGVIGYLGEYESGSKEVRKFLKPTAELLKGKVLPVIIARPELIYDERFSDSGAYGVFRNPANKPFPVIPFERWDEVSLSEDYFTGRSAEEIAVGDMFTINTDGLLTYSEGAPEAAANAVYFKVTGVSNSHLPQYVHSNGEGSVKPYKMVDVEIIINEASATE